MDPTLGLSSLPIKKSYNGLPLFPPNANMVSGEDGSVLFLNEKDNIKEEFLTIDFVFQYIPITQNSPIYNFSWKIQIQQCLERVPASVDETGLEIKGVGKVQQSG
ncbi:hypothetical protein AX774_g6392 [Zancudomyces culisetae]|uniref:Uncharacterized protein n=1 Tax=Zancudomyces culisetae TaxID=1213189 RepID=A0A1R1PGW5_ZANCU|nr:hypothetical protein AX774_g6392 [Zancudomyces culisetae]|eukprot:OMH80169.1 hypothetical protein AX774_g6392 [Zancudomyces culisetae]